MRTAPRSDFPHFLALPTRWMDNDVYGHVNNVVYYAFFDTAVNQFLIERGVLDIHKGEVVGFVVDSGCSYFSSVSFPDTIHAGIRVAKLGNSSVRYEVALYRNDDPLPCPALQATLSMCMSSAPAIVQCPFPKMYAQFLHRFMLRRRRKGSAERSTDTTTQAALHVRWTGSAHSQADSSDSLWPTDTCSTAQAGFDDHAMKGRDDKYVGAPQQVVAVDNG